MDTLNYRYFLGFRPDTALRGLLASVGGMVEQNVRPERLHLTLCVIAELLQRDRFLLSRIRAALFGQALHSVPILLGRVESGAGGAMVRATGRQDGLQDFYRALIASLARRGLAPMHRKSGLRPHVTLGYDPCRFAPFRLAAEWLPEELLLIESEIGRARHNVLGRWPLLPPRQGRLPFGAAPSSGWRLAS